jgi:SAM-dependent methyltransferase
MPVWKHVDERPSAKEDGELYSDVADLYHEFRPRYPDALVDDAAATLSKNARILEIGSGPGTATLSLLQRGFQVTCIEPSSGMIQKAKQVCRDYLHQVTFHQVTLEDFMEQTEEECCYDAILAATSFHWAMDSEGIVVKRCHSLLKPNGKLILLWNIPPEPEESVRDAVATATSQESPFYFGGYSVVQHQQNIREKIQSPVEATGLFTAFTVQDYPTETIMGVTDYIDMVRTFSHYIRMPDEERELFFQIAEKTMTDKCGLNVETTGLSILNVATKVDGEERMGATKV